MRGLDTRDLSHEKLPALCSEDRCLDEVMLHGLADVAARAQRDTVVVMHQLGNHGPAYFRRYPPDLRRFVPACESQDLRSCSREEIVNAYDNAILYTDRFLARTISALGALESDASRWRSSTCRTTASRLARTACTCTACRT